MQNDDLIHDWMISYLKNRLSRDYDDIRINLEQDRSNEYNGHYPDLILENHGLVLAVMEVETEQTITSEKADQWKTMAGLGAKLILMVPKTWKPRVLDILWKNGMADKASVGSYEMNVQMP
jgi:hypothetical protein